MQDEFNTNSWSQFWLMVWAIAILDDADRREEEKRKKQQREKRIAEECRAKARRSLSCRQNRPS